MTEADKEAQAELTRPATRIFNAGSIHLLWKNIKTAREHKLQADLRALNTCQAQNQANMDVEMALEKEGEHQLQTNDLINKTVEKRMKPILAKLQSLEAKTAKNSLGGCRAQASQPSARGTGKGKPSEQSNANSSKKNPSKGAVKGKQAKKKTVLPPQQSKRPATPSKQKTQSKQKTIANKKRGSASQDGANSTGNKRRK